MLVVEPTMPLVALRPHAGAAGAEPIVITPPWTLK